MTLDVISPAEIRERLYCVGLLFYSPLQLGQKKRQKEKGKANFSFSVQLEQRLSKNQALLSEPHDCRILSAKKVLGALAGVAKWIECRPVNQWVTSSIPSQGSCLGCGPGPQ